MAERESTGIEEFGLGHDALELIREVFRQHPEVREVKIFGSRATGRSENCSDIDLALWGDLDRSLVGRIARELDELPLPYIFDIQAYESIQHGPLKSRIDETGKTLFAAQA